MNQTFQIGEKYRNRRGKYEVVSIDGSKMVIRYLNGGTIETTVALQSRILTNLQAEELLEQLEQKSPSRRRSRGNRKRTIKKAAFQSLQEHDFQKGVVGTSWRARTGLGGLLAQNMTEAAGQPFQSYAIYRQPMVHVVRAKDYDKKIKWQKAKFMLELSPKGAEYGFHIEKNDGPMDASWHWLAFLAALESKSQLSQTLMDAMHQLGLSWKIIESAESESVVTLSTMTVKASPTGMTLKRNDEGEEETDWPTFVQMLRDLDAENWFDLYLSAWIPKKQVIDAGVHFAGQVTKVYRALLPLYDASTKRSR